MNGWAILSGSRRDTATYDNPKWVNLRLTPWANLYCRYAADIANFGPAGCATGSRSQPVLGTHPPHAEWDRLQQKAIRSHPLQSILGPRYDPRLGRRVGGGRDGAAVRRRSMTTRSHAVGGPDNGSGWKQSSPPGSFRCRGSPGRHGSPVGAEPWARAHGQCHRACARCSDSAVRSVGSARCPIAY